MPKPRRVWFTVLALVLVAVLFFLSPILLRL